MGIANDVMRFRFSVMPKLYDVLVGPLFAVGALDRTRRVDDGPGNVLTTQEEGNALRGDQGNALIGILRSVGTRVAGARPR